MSMKNTFKLTSIAALAAITLTAPVLIGSGFAQMGDMPMGNSGSMSMKSMGALEKLSGKKFDIAWISQMIAHHDGAVEMAQACVSDCKQAEVKKAAQTIINAQSKEIKQMTGWLKSWYNTTPDKTQMALMRTDMKSMMDTSMGKMPGHEMNMSANPDKSFLEGMIPHHQSAVDMARLALKKAAKPELKTFARQVISDQSKEIAQFKTWLKGM